MADKVPSNPYVWLRTTKISLPTFFSSMWKIEGGGELLAGISSPDLLLLVLR
jgi:hypothetical protein